MNIQQTRNAQNAIRQAIINTNHGVMKIENVVRLVNAAWIDANQCYPLPYGEYKRRAWLLADLTRIQMQLAEQLRDLEHAAGLPVDEETGTDTREFSGNDIESAHAEALEINDAFTIAVRQACCFADLDSATPNAINNATAYVRQRLMELNRYNARFIVSMMSSVSRQAKVARAAAKVAHHEMLERCAKATPDQLNEIPF